MAVRVAGEQAVRPSARPMVPVVWLIVPALLAALVLGGFWFYGWYHSRSSNTTPVALGGLAWGDTVLYNRREMRAWLGEHGGSYRRWKRRHPAAYRIITHKTHATQPTR